MAQQLFVSYSRQDRALVVPVVRLLRAATPGWVFQDEDTIVPGRRWRPQIETALTDAHLVMVFWCRHAQQSVEVSREYRSAIDLQKEVLPILLDVTPLPPDLEEFHGIDFSAAIAHEGERAGRTTRESGPTRPPAILSAPSRPRRSGWLRPLPVMAGLVGVGLTFVMMFGVMFSNTPHDVTQSRSVDPARAPAPADDAVLQRSMPTDPAVDPPSRDPGSETVRPRRPAPLDPPTDAPESTQTAPARVLVLTLLLGVTLILLVGLVRRRRCKKKIEPVIHASKPVTEMVEMLRVELERRSNQ